jgi:hypothetical protein
MILLGFCQRINIRRVVSVSMTMVMPVAMVVVMGCSL